MGLNGTADEKLTPAKLEILLKTNPALMEVAKGVLVEEGDKNLLLHPGLATRMQVKSLEKVFDPHEDVEKDHNEALGSRQIPAEENTSFSTLSSDIVPPPINFRLWASQLVRSTRLNRGIRIKVRNTVGLGWGIKAKKGFEIRDETPAAEAAETQRQLDAAREFFNNLNPEMPFETLMERVCIDEEAIGNGYLEFTRDGAGNLDQAFHGAGVSIFILKGNRGFVQIRGSKRKYFKHFGDERVMDCNTGKFEGEQGFRGPLAIEDRATELLHFQVYSPESDHYGVPTWISAASSIAGNAMAGKRNVAFFKNDTVPRMAVLVSGGTISIEQEEAIRDFFEEGKGVDNAGRVIVIQASMDGVGVDDQVKANIKLQPLTVGKPEDASFLQYREANDEEIREALGISEVFFKTKSLTKASATVSKKTTDEQEFSPARKQKTHLINHRIVQGELGLDRVEFFFRTPDITEPTEKAEVDRKYTLAGALTPNEIRTRSLGLDPFPQENAWANLPVAISQLISNSGGIVPGTESTIPPSPEQKERPSDNKLLPIDILESMDEEEEEQSLVDDLATGEDNRNIVEEQSTEQEKPSWWKRIFRAR